jgi:hypothetical protein
LLALADGEFQARRAGSKAALPRLDHCWSAALPVPSTIAGVSDIPDNRARVGWSCSGEVWTDGKGRAVVVLPPFVRVHRAGFEYELTPIASRSSAVVDREIEDGRFTIATDEPHVKVALRVTALSDKGSVPTPEEEQP